MNLLKETLDVIKPADRKAMERTRNKWDGLVKPIGSLGLMEEVTIKLSGITGKVDNKLDRKVIVVMCSDNGVLEEGVSAAPQVFTQLLAESMTKGITGVATMAKFVGSDLVTVDLGMNGQVDIPGVMDKKIANGTRNLAVESAMTHDEAIRSIETGIEVGDELFQKGYDILGTGELGMGNTTTSAAMLSVLGDLDVAITCGKGAGLTEDQYLHKMNVIKRGIEVNKPDKDDPIDVLAKVGGFDIGGMCGLFLSAAKNRKPVVMDGFISSAAALCAIKLNPNVRDYIIPSHLSQEPGSVAMMKVLDMSPMVTMKMRLGEGSGCPLAFQILDTALFTLENMGTFKEASINSEVLVDMREEE
ncbi:nicotinate-nucleotide--dimethylbenzimidazole phosphoribosyltransferase [Gudongella sp. SC589]|jgi:nicotinate-nucleotide--dimethylbenzimidazole phosphoribosyltransferase|uniref:nicotinate-nucleotide--dimethylbenzimidazole phosphoribosyltransferase n=1 Tax=Gudongella sp. SC589 TaxID=3385990 RepID=UPI003904A3EA